MGVYAIGGSEHLGDGVEESGVEVGHLVDFVITNIGPNASDVYSRWARGWIGRA